MNTLALAFPALDPLVHTALVNAVLATLLSLLVLAIARWIRRPAVVWCLWLLVLLKLLTPPLAPLHLPILSATVPEDSPAAGIARAEPKRDTPAQLDPTVPRDVDPAANPPSFSPEQLTAIAQSILQTTSADGGEAVDSSPVGEPTFVSVEQDSGVVTDSTAARSAALPSTVVRSPTSTTSWPVVDLFVLIWIAGSLAWLLLAVVRIARFRRLLAKTRPASPQLLSEVESLAAQIGLKRIPQVRLTAARTSPLVWAMGRRATLLLPARLLGRLDDAQRSGLLLHELAHLRRRDHWVRWLELAALGLYWWLPTVWWARRRLQQAEEECCDAWVVQTLPHCARAYAKALLETVEFLSAPRMAMPPAASGMSEALQLKRRLNVILHEQPRRRMSWTWRIAVATVAIAVLPVAPHLLRAQPRDPSPETTQQLIPPPAESTTDARETPGDSEGVAEIAAAVDGTANRAWSQAIATKCAQCHDVAQDHGKSGDTQLALVHQLVAQRLAEQPLPPAQREERATLLRRLSLDLRGTVPTPQEIEQFENDERADAVERAVNYLLGQAATSDRFRHRWSQLLGVDTGAMVGGDDSENARNDPQAAMLRNWKLALAHDPQAKPEGRDVDAKLVRLEKAVDALVAEIRALRESVGRDTSRTVRAQAADARPPRSNASPKAAPRWESPAQQPAAAWTIQSLATASGAVVVTVRDADGTIRCKNSKGQLLWQTSLGKRILPEPMVHGDHAYFLVQQAPLIAIVDLKNGRWTLMDLPSVRLSGNDPGQDLPAGAGPMPGHRHEFDDAANSPIEAARSINEAPSQQNNLSNALKGREKSYEARIKALEERTEQLLRRLESQPSPPPKPSGEGAGQYIVPPRNDAGTRSESVPANGSGAAAAEGRSVKTVRQ